MLLLTKLKIPFKNFQTEEDDDKGRLTAVGLLSLIQVSESNKHMNVVLKSTLKTDPKFPPTTTNNEFCYLKHCHLCNKKLSLDKDIYMYRGDQGFCSIECRNRQIVMDEMTELEASTEKTVKSYRHCSRTAGRRETQSILEDLRRRQNNKPLPEQKTNHWAIVS